MTNTLRAIRDHFLLSRNQLAEIAKVGNSYIAQIETGSHKLSYNLKRVVMLELGISELELLEIERKYEEKLQRHARILPITRKLIEAIELLPIYQAIDDFLGERTYNISVISNGFNVDWHKLVVYELYDGNYISKPIFIDENKGWVHLQGIGEISLEQAVEHFRYGMAKFEGKVIESEVYA
ncbi:helix-turn-helix transcriptional regulator [Rummeliibacillus sp. TYF-LIM-RU47]|uniref:helix-turn-helix domain-containing protein n=1 Tax=Rummeliibacillus sp. TYF-LIM-RU47 TaxID=2608406 RepID=UPI00123A4940|nr:helix-turn-helix transcriptional regulator [Rummeliibacillus sp. TYF-LIM-RU47]